MVGQLQHRQTLAAHGTVAYGCLRIALHLCYLAILHVDDDTAAAVTTATTGTYLLCLYHG